MNLKILLPFRVFSETSGVSHIVAETYDGSFGLLPQRLDCIAALEPGILTYQTEADDEVFVAVDEGVLVKKGSDVVVSVRHAQSGLDLKLLRAAVETEFLTLDLRKKEIHSMMITLEAGFLRRFATFQHER